MSGLFQNVRFIITVVISVIVISTTVRLQNLSDIFIFKLRDSI